MEYCSFLKSYAFGGIVTVVQILSDSVLEYSKFAGGARTGFLSDLETESVSSTSLLWSLSFFRALKYSSSVNTLKSQILSYLSLVMYISMICFVKPTSGVLLTKESIRS